MRATGGDQTYGEEGSAEAHAVEDDRQERASVGVGRGAIGRSPRTVLGKETTGTLLDFIGKLFRRDKRRRVGGRALPGKY